MTESGTLTVLSERVPSERERWMHAWASSVHREPFAHPSFVAAFGPTRSEACCALYQQGDFIAMFPFSVRRLDKDWMVAALGGNDWIDLKGAYGYAGAWISSGLNGAAGSFWKPFDEWCLSQRVVSLFATLPLHDARHAAPPDGVFVLGHNVLCDVTRRPEEIWSSYEHKVRKNINRARTNGLTVCIGGDVDSLTNFEDIYWSTMERRSADPWYRFSHGLLERFLQDMPSESYTFAEVHAGGNVVSTELVLRSTFSTYSFLGGTRADSFHLRPNDLLKHEIILWSGALGHSDFVLGGGPRDDSGVLRYKRSFSPNGVTELHGVRRILSDDAYEKLLAARNGNNSDSYFPAYRASEAGSDLLIKIEDGDAHVR